MLKKYKKLIICIVMLILGISITNTVFADAAEFQVFKEEIPLRIQKKRLGPYSYTIGDQEWLFYCGEGMKKYNAQLTKATYDSWFRNYTDKEGDSIRTAYDGSQPSGGSISSIAYTQNTERITDQALAYALATAQERRLTLTQIEMAYTIWGIPGVNKGKLEKTTALANEAIAYRKFYERTHDKNGNSALEMSIEKAADMKVGIDTTASDNKPYTVGWYKVNVTTGGTEVDRDDTVNEEEGTEVDESAQLSFEYMKLNKMHSTIASLADGSMYLEIKNNIDESSDGTITFRKDEHNKTTIKYKTNTDEQKEAIIKLYTKMIEVGRKLGYGDSIGTPDELRQAIIEYTNVAKEVRENIKLKSTGKCTTELDDLIAIGEATISAVDYSYGENSNNSISDSDFMFIDKITIIGYDANGNKIGEIAQNTIDNDSAITLLDGSGNEITNEVVVDTSTGNKQRRKLPKLGQKFYVKFASNNDNVKAIGIEAEIKYLDNCYADAYYFDGYHCQYTWEYKKVYVEENSSDSTVHSEVATTCPGGETKPDGTKCTGGEATSYKYYKQYYYLKKEIIYQQEQQKQIGVKYTGNVTAEGYKTIKASKNWKTKQKATKGQDRTNISMELGGYVWIDKDTGKVNTGDSILNDLNNTGDLSNKNEVLPEAEVWLYEYTGVNSENKIQGKRLVGIKLTDQNGYYKFEKLNAEKKYYVQFVYNGMLYTDVDYNKGNPEYNSSDWKKTSKAQELNSSRNNLNNQFEEIGSYPENYKISNKMFDDIGDYNIAFTQGEIEDIFKQISKALAENNDGDLKNACIKVAGNNASETKKRKIQFAADCRVIARTDTQKKQMNGADNTYIYPVYDKFTITKENSAQNIAGTSYNAIYPGQRYINLGIKAIKTVDLALYKDVEKATVSINGKTETYNYASWEEATIGVNEETYLEGIRTAYRGGANYTNDLQTRDIETTAYNLYTRSEEMTNGDEVKNGNRVLNGEAYNLSAEDKLNIEVTYKINVVNQSSTTAAVTDIVDYYDNNYEFKSAYAKVKNEEVNVKVETNNNTAGFTHTNNSQFKSGQYQTIYLKPDLTKLGNNESLEVYVTFTLKNKNEDSSTLLNRVLKQEEKEQLKAMNIAEIDGYKTYNDNGSIIRGLVDIDSNPGNLNLTKIDSKLLKELSDIDTIVANRTKNNEYKKAFETLKGMYEDDTSRAPAMVFSKYDARTISGTVFEDTTSNSKEINTGNDRKGDGQLTNDTKIKGVIVELVEIKNGKMYTRAFTTTDDNGNYKFSNFLPGDYTVRYTYGSNNDTALATNSVFEKGQNAKSYNGQDYQSTIFTSKAQSQSTNGYDVSGTTRKDNIIKYNNGQSPVYWYTDTNKRYSDAQDDTARVNEVIAYSKETDGKEIVNHKAEVFNAYVNPQPAHINNSNSNKELVEELKDKTYRYAYTPEIEVEVEYAKQETSGTESSSSYAHNIEKVDFGIVERPRSELVIDQDIARIKVTAADGATVLFDATAGTSNLQWIKETKTGKGTLYNGKDLNDYGKNELANIIMDEELISGAKLEITYRFTVTNNSEKDVNSTTSAKTIINYVSNNLNFDADKNEQNKWKVVKATDVQNANRNTYINNATYNNNKTVDLSTQTTILQTDENNNLIKALQPGEQTSEELVLTKVLSAESTLDDLTYTNLAEIVEIDNTVGRYDHGATPGNQSLEKNPQEHDAVGASKYADTADTDHPQDGTVIITPPTGSNYIYYAIGITSAIILAAGIYLIKKFAIDKK